MTTVTTAATYKTQITGDLPDWGLKDVDFQLVAAFFNGAGEEVLAGKTYTMTLDANGNDDGAFYLPTPDNTGDTAVNWRLTLPSGYEEIVTVGYSATAQSVHDLIAAGSTTTDPDTIVAALAAKANKVTGATAGNLASLTAAGDLADSGYGVLDEDDMASDSATAVPTQQSVKAYVDANAGGASDVGDLTTTGLTAANMLRVAAAGGLEERTPAQVLSDIGAAAASHTHAASAITNTPAGNIAAVTVQAALNELDTEKAALAGATFTGDVTINKASGNITIGDASGLPTLKMRGSLTALLSTDNELQIGTGYTSVAARTTFNVNYETAGTNDTLNGLVLQRRTTNTPAAGLGIRHQFQIEGSTVVAHPAADITATTLDPTNATRTIELAMGVYYGAYPGTYQEVMAMQSANGAPKLSFFGVAPVSRPAAYTPTNVSADRAYNADSTTLDEIADVLGTLIADLQGLGLIS